jgi:DNA-binding MarR family transcriptional regulator
MIANRAPDPDEGSLSRRITAGFQRIATAIRSQAWSRADGQGLTPTQGEILRFLGARVTPLRLSQIAKYLAISPATASDAVMTLVKKGLAHKTRAADDGRALAVQLTNGGWAAAQQAEHWGDFLLPAIESLPAEQRVALFSALVSIIRHLQGKGLVPVTRMCSACKYFGTNDAQAVDGRPHYCHLMRAPFGVANLRLDCAEFEQERGAA